MITGANAGIGKITALELAKQGAQVVMVARSQARGAEAQADVIAASGNRDVHLLQADLSSKAEIRKLAAQFKRDFTRLDVLVNNAGAFFNRRQLSVDGFEMTFALNHLGYFLLTHLLLDALQASAPARIVNVSSDAHRGAKIDFDDLQAERGYAGFRVYGISKLANVLFTYELARRLAGTGVTANALHPGFVATNFGRNNGFVVDKLFGLLGRFFAKSPQEGAETSIYLAASPEVAGVTGQYFVDKKAVKSSPASYDADAARRLWEISEELVGLAVSV
jgi:NAD(P)-dependent dehydrogenase (short-subunit alcohol dehydrogenase family)